MGFTNLVFNTIMSGWVRKRGCGWPQGKKGEAFQGLFRSSYTTKHTAFWPQPFFIYFQKGFFFRFAISLVCNSLITPQRPNLHALRFSVLFLAEKKIGEKSWFSLHFFLESVWSRFFTAGLHRFFERPLSAVAFFRDLRQVNTGFGGSFYKRCNVTLKPMYFLVNLTF